MSELSIPTDHEHFQIRSGRRTSLPVMIAVHSTKLGPAIGGLRIKPYEYASDGIADCLRLSEAMTMKAAAVDNGSGGGKAVVPLPLDLLLTPALREAVLLDVADHVHELDGKYYVAPDVGTGPEDIDVIYRRTPYVGGKSKAAGGAGGTTVGTFIGVDAAIRTAAREILGAESLVGLTICIIGLGGIGILLAESFAAEGARLILSDIDEQKREVASSLGAEWLDPSAALTAECDVLAPCALGGILTSENVGSLSARIICGAANNQLANDQAAQILDDHKIVFVPDFIANAGGLMFASGIEFHHRNEVDATNRVRESISRNVSLVIGRAKQQNINCLQAALELAKARLTGVSLY